MADSHPPADGGEVGPRLRQARQDRGWSLAEAATASGERFKASTLAAYERGERRVTVDTLCALAELYETSVAGLLPPTAPPGTPGAELAERIGHLPRPHRRLVSSLVERMLRDTRAPAGAAVAPSDPDPTPSPGPAP